MSEPEAAEDETQPPPEPPMTAAEFKRWRKLMRLTQQEAADLLGRSRRQIRYYEDNHEIPRAVALACAAIFLRVGLSDLRAHPDFMGLEKT